MKKSILNIILILLIIIGLTGCGTNTKLATIAKNINNSSSVKNYNESGYKLKAIATKDSLIIRTKMDKTKSEVKFKLNGNILKNDNLKTNDLLSALLLINGVGQTYGYKDGELSQNLNAFPDEIQNYTLENEGIELKINEEKVSMKIDISKKIPLIDMDKFYLTTEDFDMVKQIIADNENGNQNGKSGNIGYNVFIGEEESTITIGQEGKLSQSAYKSILSALEVMYGKEVSEHFQEIYPNFIEGKTNIEAFTIDTDYKVEDQENSVFKDTKVVLVTINNQKLKEK